MRNDASFIYEYVISHSLYISYSTSTKRNAKLKTTYCYTRMELSLLQTIYNVRISSIAEWKSNDSFVRNRTIPCSFDFYITMATSVIFLIFPYHFGIILRYWINMILTLLSRYPTDIIIHPRLS